MGSTLRYTRISILEMVGPFPNGGCRRISLEAIFSVILFNFNPRVGKRQTRDTC